jgi:predicted NBD/HSP70 family sugar kinase
MGLIKRRYPGSEVYITPTTDEVQVLLSLGCEVTALDGTARRRPGGALPELIRLVHEGGGLAMGDCDTLQSAQYALEAGADLIGTTLSGYTAETSASTGPDLGLLRSLMTLGRPVIAEGRYQERWQVEAALRIGASAVVVGGALNDPVKNTRRLMPRGRPSDGNVGAVDIGGTWLRFGVFTADLQLLTSEKVPLPASPDERLSWIAAQARKAGVRRLGISTGGIVDRSGRVVEAKPIIPGHVGTDFRTLESTAGVESVTALNDGLATAWGHACRPDFAGLNVATLAIGTGVGMGFVREGKLQIGANGAPSHLNDLPAPGGATYEALLGGAALTSTPTPEQKRLAHEAFESAVHTICTMLMPDVVVVCGGIGLQPWLQTEGLIVRSPFGQDAGLYGAASLAIFPPFG